MPNSEFCYVPISIARLVNPANVAEKPHRHSFLFGSEFSPICQRDEPINWFYTPIAIAPPRSADFLLGANKIFCHLERSMTDLRPAFLPR